MYKEVCQACHSLQYLTFRHHVDVTHTKEEMKAAASEVSIYSRGLSFIISIL